jgi:nicotinamidase-related amidase
MEDFDLDRAALLLLDFQKLWHRSRRLLGEARRARLARRSAARDGESVTGTGRGTAGSASRRPPGGGLAPGKPGGEHLGAALLARPGALRGGHLGSAVCEAVKPLAGEIVVYKRGVSALAGTELGRLFRIRDVRTLVLSGVATHFAVEGTAREAVDRGYRVVVLEDCCASRERAVHEYSIERILRNLCEVTTGERFIAELAARAERRGGAVIGRSGGEAQGDV